MPTIGLRFRRGVESMSGVLEFLAELAAMLLPSWIERRVAPRALIGVALGMLAVLVAAVVVVIVAIGGK